jgi:stage III sporulation protein AH
MVILSAYYLFTEDLDPSSNKLASEGSQNQTVQGATEATAGQDGSAIVVNEVEGKATGQTADADGISEEDQKTIDMLESQGVTAAANNIFTDLQYKRTENYNKASDELMAVISNPKDASSDEANQALTKLDALEDKMDKITALEEQLNKLFPIAVVDDESDHYKVVVQSERLEPSQAVEIVDMVTKSLEVAPEQVRVQYVP